MNKINNKTKKSISIIQIIITPILSAFIGLIVGQFFAMPFLLKGRSDPIDSTINYTVSPSQKAIAQNALIIPNYVAALGLIIGCYIIYKQIKTHNNCYEGRMKKIMEILQAVISFIEPYPYWVKVIIGIWVLLTAIILVALLFAPKDTSLSVSEKVQHEMKKPKGDINQTIVGNNNVQVGTIGDNSLIIIDKRPGLVQRKIPSGISFQVLLPFAGTKVYLHWRADDNESVTFKNNLLKFLEASKWEVTSSSGHVADESFQNVILDLNANINDNAKALQAANALKTILDEQRIKTTILKRQDNHLSNDEMYIRIGSLQ